MDFPAPLVPGRLLKRYKRFLADVAFPDGTITTAHCANPGSMLGLNAPGAPVWLSKSTNPKRKLAYSWELTEVDFGRGPRMVGINTAHPNTLVAEALAAGLLPELGPFTGLRREVKYGNNSRIDILLSHNDGRQSYVEVKNVHLFRKPGFAEFPDSVTARGAKHLGELAAMTEAGHRAALVFLVQCEDADSVGLARDIDPAYAAAWDDAMARGVAAYAIKCAVTPQAITAIGTVPLRD